MYRKLAVIASDNEDSDRSIALYLGNLFASLITASLFPYNLSASLITSPLLFYPLIVSYTLLSSLRNSYLLF